MVSPTRPQSRGGWTAALRSGHQELAPNRSDLKGRAEEDGQQTASKPEWQARKSNPLRRSCVASKTCLSRPAPSGAGSLSAVWRNYAATVRNNTREKFIAIDRRGTGATIAPRKLIRSRSRFAASTGNFSRRRFSAEVVGAIFLLAGERNALRLNQLFGLLKRKISFRKTTDQRRLTIDGQ